MRGWGLPSERECAIVVMPLDILAARRPDFLTSVPPPSLPGMELLRPPPLQKGDTIGVVASSYSPRAAWLARGVRALERAGYEVLLDPELTVTRRYLRAEDERRADNFTRMWVDPRVK